MALQVQIETDSGISLDNAVLVIDHLVETNQVTLSYNLARDTKESQVKFKGISVPNQSIGCAFRVQVYASEELLIAGKSPVSILQDQDKQLFTVVLDSDSSLSAVEQAYNHLKTLYPQAIALDLSNIGVL